MSIFNENIRALRVRISQNELQIRDLEWALAFGVDPGKPLPPDNTVLRLKAETIELKTLLQQLEGQSHGDGVSNFPAHMAASSQTRSEGNGDEI